MFLNRGCVFINCTGPNDNLWLQWFMISWLFYFTQVRMFVSGRYVVEVALYGYNNPTQTCHDCRDGQFADLGCCDRQDRTTCNGGDRCDSYFIYCLRTIGSSGRNCSYFGTRISTANSNDASINFNQSSVLGLENPLQMQGLTDTYTVSYNID